MMGFIKKMLKFTLCKQTVSSLHNYYEEMKMNNEKFVIMAPRKKQTQLVNGYIIMHIGLMFLAYYFVV